MKVKYFIRMFLLFVIGGGLIFFGMKNFQPVNSDHQKSKKWTEVRGEIVGFRKSDGEEFFATISNLNLESKDSEEVSVNDGGNINETEISYGNSQPEIGKNIWIYQNPSNPNEFIQAPFESSRFILPVGMILLGVIVVFSTILSVIIYIFKVKGGKNV